MMQDDAKIQENMFGMVYCSWMYLSVWSRFWNWNTKTMVNQWASLSPGVFLVKACKVWQKLVGKDCIGFSLSIKSRLTEEGLACRCIQFWDNFHPAWPKQQCSPLLFRHWQPIAKQSLLPIFNFPHLSEIFYQFPENICLFAEYSSRLPTNAKKADRKL